MMWTYPSTIHHLQVDFWIGHNEVEMRRESLIAKQGILVLFSCISGHPTQNQLTTSGKNLHVKYKIITPKSYTQLF